MKEQIEEKHLKECGMKIFYKYYHICKDGVEHNLVKSGLRVGKRGKAYNKTNNCIVCKKKNIRRQTTFICGKCNVPLYSPELTKRSKSPRDCFRDYHNNNNCECDFFVNECKEVDSNFSDEVLKKNKG